MFYLYIDKLIKMETLTIQLTNQKAAGLLHEMEELNLIKVIRIITTAKIPKKLSEKYKGIITKEQGENLSQHINQMKNEWNNI